MWSEENAGTHRDKKKKKITKIRNRLLLQERVKRLRRGWGRGDGGGGGGGWVGGGQRA